MKFLLATLFLLSSLSAFALPEDFYFDAPYTLEVVEVKVKVVDEVEATNENADTICRDLGYSKATTYSHSPKTEGEVPHLVSVKCSK